MQMALMENKPSNLTQLIPVLGEAQNKNEDMMRI